jgi:hypothetical protein
VERLNSSLSSFAATNFQYSTKMATLNHSVVSLLARALVPVPSRISATTT